MNKSLLAGLSVVAALVLVFAGYQFGSGQALNLGAVINYYSSMNNARLYTTLNSLLTDITATRLPLSAIDQATTASLLFPAFEAATSTSQGTSTTVTGLVAAAGDLVFVEPVTANPGVVFSGAVSTASTTSATIRIYARQTATGTTALGAAVIPVASTFQITVVPFATFKAAAALTTTNTTSTASTTAITQY